MTPLLRLRRVLAGRALSAAPWLAYRRSLGITAAVLGLLHGALVLATYLQGSWRTVFGVPYLRAGAICLAILLALLSTSFPPLTRRLRVRRWKELHRLSYVAALFLLQHLLLSPFAPRQRIFVLFGLLLAVSLLRLLPGRKPRLAPASGKR